VTHASLTRSQFVGTEKQSQFFPLNYVYTAPGSELGTGSLDNQGGNSPGIASGQFAEWAVCRFDVSGGFKYTKATTAQTLS
jgi:hypothetical protein